MFKSYCEYILYQLKTLKQLLLIENKYSRQTYNVFMYQQS